MEKEKIRFAGNILRELSEKIPNYNVALNELLKNSYDAGSPDISIEICPKESIMVVSDNGKGMNRNSIKELFHVSRSSKVYGIINEYGRYTQGSKGLGFLSAFKFGSIVEWISINEGRKYRFCVEFEDIVRLDDVSEYDINIEEYSTSKPNGTKIFIKLSKEQLEDIQNYFNYPTNVNKIIHSFLDQSFLIELKVNGITYTNNQSPSLESTLPEKIIYKITYNSDDEIIRYSHRGTEILTKLFNCPSKDFNITLELFSFKLKSGDTKKIDRLFHSPKEILTPLIYINDNMFNNYTLYDPDINRKSGNKKGLPQTIGYIKIVSSNENLQFNSDRTNFQENRLTNIITKFISDLNKTIQEYGAQHKQHLVEFDILNNESFEKNLNDVTDLFLKTNIKDSFRFNHLVRIERQKNQAIYSFSNRKRICTFLDSTKKEKIFEPNINFKNDAPVISTNSNPINPKQLILSSINSEGESIIDKLIIKSDDILIKNNVIPSVPDEKDIKVTFEYVDVKTGLMRRELTIKFIKDRVKFKSKSKYEHIELIHHNFKSDYVMSLGDLIDKLVQQINFVYKKHNFIELVATSMRSILEISIYKLIDSGKFSEINVTTNLFDNIEKIIMTCKRNDILREIAKSTLSKESKLKNILITDDYKNTYRKCHLGAHFANTYITTKDVEDMGSKIGIFLVFVNELLNNPDIASIKN